MHCQASMTCHIALAVTQRPPLLHTQASRRPLLKSHHRFRVHHMDNTRSVHYPGIWSRPITPDGRSLPTRSSVMPEPQNSRVIIQSSPAQQQGQCRRRFIRAPHPIHSDAPQIALNRLLGTRRQLLRVA